MTSVNIATAEPSVEHTKDVSHTAPSLFGFRPVRASLSHLFFFLSFWGTEIKGICQHTQKYLPSQSKAFAFTIKAFAETIDFSRRQVGFSDEETKRFQQIGVHECLDKTDNGVQWIF